MPYSTYYTAQHSKMFDAMKRTITTTCCAALAVALITGCQGRLDMVLHNDSGETVVIVSDGHSHSLSDNNELRLRTPSDKDLILVWGGRTNVYALPFNPRPHTLNEYMNGGRLEIRIQIAADHTLLVLPDGVPFSASNTNLSAKVIRIAGEKK